MLVLLAFALWFGSTEHAFAYLDPVTGSILLQAIIGGVATGLFVMRGYWRKTNPSAVIAEGAGGED
jgi:hypothetical protein